MLLNNSLERMITLWLYERSSVKSHVLRMPFPFAMYRHSMILKGFTVAILECLTPWVHHPKRARSINVAKADHERRRHTFDSPTGVVW